jgi:hypothetical protein
MNRFKAAYAKHKEQAAECYALFVRDYCGGNRPRRVPGMDTVIRLAWRIECGHTVESAACREYLYRWALAVKDFDQLGYGGREQGYGYAPSCFGTPHCIGM